MLVAKFQLFGSHTRGRPYDLLAVEQAVLGLLGARACPVPRLLGLEAETSFVFFEHCGSHTLDDLVQERGADGASGCTRRAIAGLCRIEEVLGENRRLLEPLVCPAGGVSHLRRAWEQAGLRARQGLEHIISFNACSAAPAAGALPLPCSTKYSTGSAPAAPLWAPPTTTRATSS